MFYFKDRIKQKHNIDISLEINIDKKNNKDWIKVFEKSIDPLEIGRFFIKTSFHKLNDNKINIEINPSLAFGTGHHFTTKSIIEHLPDFYRKDFNLIDVGCGSGILSIVASKLGFNVSSCDIDEMAIKVSKENFEKNNVLSDIQDISLGSIDNNLNKYNIVLANLVSSVIVDLANDFKKIIQSKGYIFFSGILRVNKKNVLEEFKNFEVIKDITSDDNEWTTLILQNKA